MRQQVSPSFGVVAWIMLCCVAITLTKFHNKAFKTDSQRLAFFIPSLGFVFKVVWLGFVVALLTT
ncbi:hypothetical protein FWP53_19020 [Vibrio parahaemolyticus]|nr:hypothetical protein [Vibrio parahaemolyticus]